MKSALDERLRQALSSYPARNKYLVGVSGGLDSVSLLHLLMQLGYKRLVVCHLDHGLRGAEARADARFVEQLAQRWNLPAAMGRAEVEALATAEKQSIETAARAARHRFFGEVARQQRCRTLFLAHHADDQVETFLFNLFRGAGPAGLAGMKAKSFLTLDPPMHGELRVVRPLLGVWRSELEEYARNHQLSWRKDASNASPVHTRNRMRREIIPALEAAFGRGIRAALWRTADVLGMEEAWLAELLAAEGKPAARLAVKDLLTQPIAKQRRLLRAWLTRQKVPEIGYALVEEVRSLLDVGNGPAKINLPGQLHARRRAGLIFIEKPPESSKPKRQKSAKIKDCCRST